MMLCSALLGLYSFFLIGINLTHPSIVCIIFGAFIHLFCLASMAWMSIEATQLYFLLVKVFNAYVTKFLIKTSVIAWGKIPHIFS
ncbi:Adhesion G-protein coupled receptor G4 [Holothuria leucospilota]|uniref:Adhesion G-protein coupled receptor G4 n=1 Tax=Holothuria leucospilota TaxID=206669 RepID=A0A9Q0YGA1_HOLLE|nr:Adhesion G-protein coupled receptor G4 [Holothuria leucospilota]